jgi:signal transduction histidine kinase
MQTLEVNFKAVFNAMPGRNVLLLPDIPFFTIVALSDDYIKAAGLPREELLGSGIVKILSETTSTTEVNQKKIFDSLELVLHTKLPGSMTIEKGQSDFFDAPVKSEKITHTPVISFDGELQYIVQTIVEEINTSIVENLAGQRPEEDVHSDISIATLIKQSPVAMGILRGRDLVIETANAHMLDLWGKGPQIIGTPVLAALPELINQPFPQLLENVYQTGVEYHGFESQAHLIRDGKLTECYFNFVYAPLKNDSGEVAGIIMVAAEVTNLVKAKKALEESDKKYRDLIANATVATAIYAGKEMTVQLANDAMLKLWGKDTSVIGKPLKDAVPELDGQPFYKLLLDVYTTGVTYHSNEDRAELVVDGQLQSFYFNFTYKALYDSSGSIYGVLNMAVDVSDTVKAKIEINNTEERWRIALESAELGTWDYFPLTKQFICSARTKELFGLPANAKPSFETLMNAVHVRDRERLRLEFSKVFDPKYDGKYRVEYAVIGINDKKERWQRATGQAFYGADGAAYRLTGTVLDITDRKRIEEALEERVNLRTSELLNANKELERSNLELEQYAYVASHDLQEPLRKILVYTDLLKDSAMRFGFPEQARLDKIMSSAQRMSYLIQDLLNFSRLLKSENIFSDVNLNQIIRNVIEDFELKIQETHATITVDALPVIEASSQQMNQLFYNLISNALKFRKEGQPPELKITASVVSRRESENYKDINPALTYFDISLSDNGIGFNAKYTAHIFEIFKRLHTRSKYEGTGIGLALCRKIARNHKGDIYAESFEGKGSVFHVLLPLKQA